MKIEDILNERIEYSLKIKNSSLEFPVYKITSKNELKGLCNKHRVIRILYNNDNTYAWNAEEADHTFVKKYIENSDNYCSIIIYDKVPEKSLFDDNKELYEKFYKKYEDIFKEKYNG